MFGPNSDSKENIILVFAYNVSFAVLSIPSPFCRSASSSGGDESPATGPSPKKGGAAE